MSDPTEDYNYPDPIIEPLNQEDNGIDDDESDPDEEFARATDGAYWAKEAERLATIEAKRILGSLAIAAARAHVRATLARWEREVWC